MPFFVPFVLQAKASIASEYPDDIIAVQKENDRHPKGYERQAPEVVRLRRVRSWAVYQQLCYQDIHGTDHGANREDPQSGHDEVGSELSPTQLGQDAEDRGRKINRCPEYASRVVVL